MQHIGYSLVDTSGQEVAFWGDTLGQCAGFPDTIAIPGSENIVLAAKPGEMLAGGHFVVERWATYGLADSIVFDGARVLVTRRVSPTAVDIERNRRLQNFVFEGTTYGFDEVSKGDIAGAGTLALAAIVQGAQPGDVQWAAPGQDFEWIAADNTKVKMDAQTTLSFATAAARWRAGHVYAARTLKDMANIPVNFADDSFWP
jgi:hypothetical protein